MSKVLNAIWRAALLLGLACSAAHSADAPEIQSSMNLLKGAQEIRHQYLLPLRLEGVSMRTALEVLVGEGFVCGIKNDLPSVLPPPNDVPVFVACSQDHARLNPKCDEVVVSLIPVRSSHSEAEDPLLRRLQSTKVQSVVAICPRSYSLRPDELAVLASQRGSSETQLASKVRDLMLLGDDVGEAFMKLLDAGYSCGVDASKHGEAAPTLRLHCTRRRSQIRGCLREDLRFDLSVSAPVPTQKQLLLSPGLAKIEAFTAACDVPLS
jgi:hypothetical protein